jgi:hypothetical protein
VTHPFHPWHGREFVLLGVRQNWAEDRAFFLDEQGVQRSLPVGWTDAVGADVFVVVAAGRCPVRVVDLLELALLIDGVAKATGQTCKFNYAVSVNLITPETSPVALALSGMAHVFQGETMPGA